MTEPMSELEKFVILSHGRTGSTTLCHGMSRHPDVQAYGEVFHKKPVVNGKEFGDGDDGAEFCREVIWKSPNEFEKRVIGFKIFFFHARGSERQYNAWRYLIGDPSIKVLSLLRRNIFDSYVSRQRSKRSGVWRVQRDGTIPEEHQSPILIDAQRCHRYMASTVAQIEWGKRAFAAHPSIEIFFEDLERDFQATLNRIFGFLGVEAKPIPVTFKKLNTAPHAEGIENYDKLQKYFEFSVFREFFISE
jgi:LPS sulfotransferase NodH